MGTNVRLAIIGCVWVVTLIILAISGESLLVPLAITTAWAVLATALLLTVGGRPETSHERDAVPEESADAEEQTQARARSELLVSLSSDIRTPLSSILDTAELAMDEDLSPRQRRQLASIHTSAQSLQDLLNDILDLAEVDLGRLQLRPVDFSFRPMLEQLLAPYVQEAKNQERTLSYHVQTRVPDGLHGDVERLQHIIQNLVTHVVATTQGDEVVLRVSVKSRDDARVELQFSILGESRLAGASGMESAVAGVESPKERDTSLPIKQQTASNLGLAVSAQLIELIGGRFWVIKEAGQPYNVCFTAKFGIGEAKTGNTSQRTQLGLIPDLPVLVVHADDNDLPELESMLIRWQTNPICVHDAQAMWADLERERTSGVPYGLVIIDAQLPEGSGFELCAQLKANQLYSATPVILLTDADHPEEAIKATKAGASMHLLKPVKSSRLAKAIVMAVLGKGRYRQMRKDLGAAEMYVRSLIPAPTNEPLKIDWRYVPAADLAGDSLGFHWIDDNFCAFYILDVCGHGLDASLLSVSVLNVLKSMALPETDFREPSQVLARLNDKFPMEAHGDRCFSAWYGVFDKRNSRLRWAGGGHPPALLLEPSLDNASGTAVAHELGSNGPLIGMLAEMEFEADEREVSEHSRLYAYSDGAFEIEMPTGEQTTFEEFVQFMREHSPEEQPTLDALWQRARELRGMDTLDDDFTILEVRF